MKKFGEYQHLDGEPMTTRDKKESGSKFWGKGKWNNFILPLLPKNCEDMTLIDMGCNKGLFLKFAKDKGFYRSIGVDSNIDAYNKGNKYLDSRCRIIHDEMQDAELPLADYTIFVNSHYYLNIGDFVPLLDKLRNRTRYCLIVSGNKQTYPHIASSREKDIRKYFKDWVEVEGVGQIDPTGDPSPRKLWTLAFKSPTLKRISMKSLDCGNHVQSEFYKQIDNGIPYKNTKYYKIIRGYRLKKNPESLSVWTENELDDFFVKKIYLYTNIKSEGLMGPIIVNEDGRILDGNHRYKIIEHLGHKTILTRQV